MPTKPPSPCSYPGCPNYAVKNGYCLQCWKEVNKNYEKTRETAVQRGYTWRWRKIRVAKLRRNPMCECEECRGEKKIADMVHHIDGNPKNNRPENLMSMHNSHHNRLHMKQGDRF